MEVLIFWVAWFGGFAALGRWIALEKGREGMLGIVLGGIFGPLGVIVLLCLPASAAAKTKPSPSSASVDPRPYQRTSAPKRSPSPPPSRSDGDDRADTIFPRPASTFDALGLDLGEEGRRLRKL